MDADELLDALEDDLTAVGHGSGTYAQRLAILRQHYSPPDALRMFLRLYIEEVSPSIEQRIADLLGEVGAA
jgi:hypothetical protein